MRTVLKNRLLQIIVKLIYSSGLFSAFLSFTNKWRIKKDQGISFPYIHRQKRSIFQILIYHRVNDENAPIFSGIPVNVFFKQAEILNKYFNVLPLEELVERAAKDDVPPNAVAITFDDGYKDNYTNAFPILKKYNLPATIFLVTGSIDSGTPLWHDRVFNAFRQTKTAAINIDGKEYSLETIPEKLIALNAFQRNLWISNPVKRDNLVNDLMNELDVQDNNCSIEHMLSWQEICEMSERGITFGAHTVTHPILSQMPLEEAVDEIGTSKKTIEDRIKKKVRLFAYPVGRKTDFDESIKQALRDTGFLGAVTTIWGNNNYHTDPVELKRIKVWDSDPGMFAMRLGFYKIF